MVCRIFKRPHLEGTLLRTSRDRDLFDLAFFLGRERSQRQGTKLEFRLDAEQGLTAPDERRGGRQGDISGFHALHDLVFEPGILDLQLVLVFECPLRIPVGEYVELVPDGTVHVHLDFLVEVGFVPDLVERRKRRLVGLRRTESRLDVHGTRDIQVDFVLAEYAEEGVRRNGNADLRDVRQHVPDVFLDEDFGLAGLRGERQPALGLQPERNILPEREGARDFRIDAPDRLAEKDPLPRGVEHHLPPV